MGSKSGQIAITFNWMYVLIAGGVILLFFVGLIFAQKEKSEQRIAIDVVDVLDSIFAGAQVSEKTLTPIKTSGIAEYTLTFECEEGVTRFGIENSEFSAQEPISPIFAPSKLQTVKMLLWSLPYQLPYKTGDFLFVTSTNTQFFIRAPPAKTDLVNEFIGASEGNDVENQMKITPIITEDEYQNIRASRDSYVRVVDFLQGASFNQPLPEGIAGLDDSKVSGVAITAQGARFYQKIGNAWQAAGAPVPLVTLEQERDAAMFGAIFAADDQMYRCAMQKAYERASLVTQIYQTKAQQLLNASNDPVCTQHYENVELALEQLRFKLDICAQGAQGCEAESIIEKAREVQSTRRLLTTAGCVQVY